MQVDEPSLLEVASEAARGAGKLLIEHRSLELSGVATKTSDTDMVSDADRAAEEFIVDQLTAAFPADAILGEEGASREGMSGRRWVIDPLDGTTNYMYGLDAFCVSIGLEDTRGPLAGCVYDPIHDELFTALRHEGAWLGDLKLAVGPTSALSQALIGTGFSYRADQREWQAKVMAELLPRVRDIRRTGSAALDLCWVAAGRLDGHVERGLAHWDHAAALLIAEEAGASVRRPPEVDPWALVMAAAPGVSAELFALVDDAERRAGPQPS